MRLAAFRAQFARRGLQKARRHPRDLRHKAAWYHAAAIRPGGRGRLANRPVFSLALMSMGGGAMRCGSEQREPTGTGRAGKAVAELAA